EGRQRSLGAGGCDDTASTPAGPGSVAALRCPASPVSCAPAHPHPADPPAAAGRRAAHRPPPDPSCPRRGPPLAAARARGAPDHGRADAARGTGRHRASPRSAAAVLRTAGPGPPGAAGSGADRTRRSALARELAGCSTPAQLTDLEAILNRYPDNMTRELRDI